MSENLMQPEWLNLLHAEKTNGKSIAQIAREIGMKRPSLSLLMSGNYPAGLDKVTRKFEPIVLKLYGAKVACPHLGHGISLDTCATHANAPMTMSSPAKLKHWSACQRCPNHPNRKDAS